MARYLDPQQLAEGVRTAYLLKIDQRSVDLPQQEHGHGCRLWTEGVSGSGYPRMRVKMDGQPSIQFGVHQVVYSFNFRIPLNQPGYDVSHRCHTRLCIRVEHLSYEPKLVNAQRNDCRFQNHCQGHHPYLNCIL